VSQTIMTVMIEVSSPELTPRYAHGFEEDAAMDLFASHALHIEPGGIGLIWTGLRMAIPAGYFGDVRNRSSMAVKGLVVNGAPLIIDPGYRGVIRVPLFNQTSKHASINEGDRVAQIVIMPYIAVDVVPVSFASLPPSKRGDNGLGSTGV
jgi:dUTP pyrophosphatase